MSDKSESYAMMSVRDHMATEAMKAILTSHKFVKGKEPQSVAWIAEAAYIMADALLEARKK